MFWILSSFPVLFSKLCSLVPRLCFPLCCILFCYQMEQLFLIATRCTFASFRIQPNQIVEMSSSFHFFGYSTECPIDHIIFLVSGGKGLFPSLLEQELATVLVRFLFKCTRFHISAALKFFRPHWDGEDRKLSATVYFQQNWVNVFLCFSEEKNTKTHRLSGAIIMLKKRQRNILSMCFCAFRRKKHKKTKTHWLSGAILLLGRRKKMGQCVFVFSGKKHKNTKTHRLSGAILMLKKDKETFGQCVFVFFGKKHIGCLVQS